MLEPRTALVLAVLIAPAAAAQPEMDDVEITATRVAGNVYMLQGRGGNIGLSIGEDGAFLIDDQFAPLTPRILASVAGLTDEPVRFVVNTHYHGDHTGGNENLGDAGAIIVAHENVRRRLTTEQFMEAFNRTVPPRPEAAPVITFTETMTFHWNDDELNIVHVAPAHTDGDSFIHFRQANVVHGGDLVFSASYPFIDVSAGGSIDGMIAAVDRILERCDARTRIIPGHGPLCGPGELRGYRAMLAAVRDRVRDLIAEGATREEVIAARPTKDYDADWGGGFMKPEVWVGIVYDGLK